MLDTCNYHHIEGIRYCFTHVVQNDLSQFVSFWNSHRIRHSRGAGCPGGVPDELYFLPPDDASDCGVVVAPAIASSFNARVTQPNICTSDSFEAYLDYLRAFYGLNVPETWQNAVSLFMKLRPHM